MKIPNMYKWSVVFIIILELCCAFEILLVFPFPKRSHSILGDGMVRHLLDAGYKITYITPYPRANPPKNLRQIDVSDNYKLLSLATGEALNIENLMKRVLPSQYSIKNLMLNVVNATVTNTNVKKLMEDPNERFDAVIVEWMYSEIYSGFSLVFGCPLIWSCSMDPYATMLSLVDESPNPAYTADYWTAVHPPFTFLQRLKQLWKRIEREFIAWALNNKQTLIYDNGFGPALVKRNAQIVPLNEVMYNGSLTLGNSHASFDQAIRLPQNYKPILGYHIPDEIMPLPKKIKKIMDAATHGVIYFSMGSILSSKSFPATVKRDLLELFRGLPQTVLWKLEEAVPELPKNVHVVDWAPQTSVLAHTNCILFITHGGLLSLTEAIHYVIPVIGVPAFADQFLNIERAVRKGFARKVNLDMDFVKNMKVALQDVLGNSSYLARMKEVSWTYHHRPVSPGAELVHWVEHVITTGGASHLHSPALLTSFYQKYYIDLAAVLLAMFFVVHFAVNCAYNHLRKICIKKEQNVITKKPNKKKNKR